MRIGHGFDCHRLVRGRDLMIGGVRIPHNRGLEGHSDGDVLVHSIADAILGALGAGDLGNWFPSENAGTAGISGHEIASKTSKILSDRGYKIGNIDATVIAQEPRLAPFQSQIRESLSDLFQTGIDSINLKITSTDLMGFVGRAEGIAAEAVALIWNREGGHG